MTRKNGNHEYRSDVFSMLLLDKRRALEVYNAINDTQYEDPELIEITTLEDNSFSLSIRNDASFVLDAHFSIYEHQSTYCPNMPLRDLIYFASMIQKRVYDQKKSIYGKRLVKIPVPHFVVFYNGIEPAPEHYELRLSDAFEHQTEKPELELICQVYNINSDNNVGLLKRCPTLRDYMYFVNHVRQYHTQTDGRDLESAIEQAISHCISVEVLKEFLMEHRAEVTKIMTMDYTFEKRLEFECAEAAEEGRKYGIKLGEENGIQKKLHEQIRKKVMRQKSLSQIAEELEEEEADIFVLYEQVKQELANES